MMRITFEKLHVENEIEHLEKLINGIETADRVLFCVSIWVFCDKIDIDSALYSAIQGRLVVQVQLMK